MSFASSASKEAKEIVCPQPKATIHEKTARTAKLNLPNVRKHEKIFTEK
jgi:hypothetical protein